MPTAIFSIGRSGLTASRASLELTAQNIANAGNANYSRRVLTQGELVLTGAIGINAVDSLGGVNGATTLALVEPVQEKSVSLVSGTRDSGLPTLEALRSVATKSR